MEPPAAPPDTEVRIPVSYQPFLGDRNPELKGRGFLTFAEGTYRFSGKNLGTFSFGTAEVRFAPDQIKNVAVVGSAVRFTMPAARSRRPFVFYCDSSAEAVAAARFLPRHVDDDFAAGMRFHAQLNSLPAAQSAVFSVTHVIVAANVAVFLAMGAFLGAGWVEVPNLRPYILYGADNGAATTDGEWWRLLTSMFMHYGAIHLVLNMWALLQVGRMVEKLQGRALFAFTYLASGVGGGLLSIYWHGDKMWSVGASGAIFGVYGTLLGHFLKEKHAIPRAVFQPIMKSTLLFAGYNLVYGMVNPIIDNSAHIGGFLTGIALGWITAMPPDPALRSSMWFRKRLQAVVFTAVMIAVGVIESPRFSYSPREQLAWSDTLAGIDTGEAPLLARQNEAMARWRAVGGNGADFAHLIDDQIVPFYLGYENSLEALKLRPGRDTDLNRRILVQALDRKIQGLRHLSRGVSQNDHTELLAAERSERESADLLKTVKLVP